MLQACFRKRMSDSHPYSPSCSRFYCRADLPKYALGESGEKEFAIHFYLADDTVEVRELRTDEAGRLIRGNRGAIQ